MGIVEEYEHALAEPPRPVSTGWWIVWATLTALVIIGVSIAIIHP